MSHRNKPNRLCPRHSASFSPDRARNDAGQFKPEIKTGIDIGLRDGIPASEMARSVQRAETNMAYRTSDYVRWQQMDFVVSIEIHLSNNHTLNGRAFSDICDELKGKYPKTFKFTG